MDTHSFTVKKKENRTKHRCMRSAQSPEFSAFGHLFPNLLNSLDKFFIYLRMTENFRKLDDIMGTLVRKMENNYRHPMEVGKKNARFLRQGFYLISGIYCQVAFCSQFLCL